MDNSYSLAPVWFTDVVGSFFMIVLAFLSVWYAVRLRRSQPENLIWTYMLWLCVSLAGFAASRGVGHIAKRLLVLMDMRDTWLALRPYSGSINTIAFVVVASVTLFFQQVQRINKGILADKKALERATGEVLHLNRNLESLVQQRTEELSRSEKKYRRIFEGSMDMIFVLDDRALFADVNRAGLTTLGYETLDEVVDKIRLEDLFVSGDEYRAIMEDLTDRGFVKDRECVLTDKKGSGLHILLSATCRKDHEGRVVSYEGIAKDITARVQMERQLQRADKLASLGQISTAIAHEINNPLGVMLGYTQLLLRDQQPESQIHDDLKVIEKHARNCKTIVEDLLKFARSTETRKQAVDVNRAVGEVLSLLTHQMELDKIRVEQDLDPDLPLILADAEKLKQVLMNLLMNAKQAISGSGAISVRTRLGVSDNCVKIAVTDSGCGIRPEFVDKIFDPFFTTKPVGEGTGLGLSVSYGIIQDHNGRIEVQSTLGKGSTFEVLLPVTEPMDDTNALSKK